MYNISGNICQAVPASLEFISKPLMVDAQDVHEGGLEIVNVHMVVDDIVSKLVGSAHGEAFFYPAPGHEYGVALGVVVPAKIVGGELSLGIIGTPEFSTPDH